MIRRVQARESGAARGRPRDAFWLVALFVLALVPRLVVVHEYEARHPMAAHPTIDEASYDAWARRIAAGDWLGEEVFFQEPLYPYALGAVYAIGGEERTLARVLQAVLGASTVCLVAGLGSRLFGRLAGRLGGLALALHGPAWLFPALLLKPNLVLPLVAGLAWALIATRDTRRAWPWLGVGFLAGLGALLRGNLLVMVPLIVGWPIWRSFASRFEGGARASLGARATLLAVGACALGVALALAPVVARNHAVGGEWVLTTSGAGTNLYGGNNAQNPFGIATEFDWVRGIPEFEAGDWRREAERRTGRELSPREVSDFWMRATLDSLRADPALHARILWNKLRLVWSAYEVPDNHHLAWDARYVPLLARWPVGFGLWGALGLAGFFATLVGLGSERARGAAGSAGRASRGQTHAGERLELAVLLVAYAGTIVLTVMSMRIRLALVPLLAPFAGAWLAWAIRARRRPRRSAGLLAVLALALAIVHAPVFDARARAADLDERDYNLAVQRLDEGRLDEAARLARELARRHAGSQRLATMLAEIEWREALDAGHAEDARRGALERAYARVAEPRGSTREQFRAHALAARLALALERPAAAVAHFAAARAYDAEDAELNLGELRARLLVDAGRADGGIEGALLDEVLGFAEGSSEESALGWRARVLAAEAEFEAGASVLRRAPGLGEADVEAARERVRSALARLRDIARHEEASGPGVGTEVEPDASADRGRSGARAGDGLGSKDVGGSAERARCEALAAARLAAARIQLDPLLANHEQAARHARRALELDAGDEARWLLARALVRDGREGAAPEAREEALALLRELEGGVYEERARLLAAAIDG